jgi:hypothetical protein
MKKAIVVWSRLRRLAEIDCCFSYLGSLVTGNA